MKIDISHLLFALGISATIAAVLRLKRSFTPVHFREIRFDEEKNEIAIVLDNRCGDTVYVRPSIRVLNLIPAEELKNQSSNGIPLASAKAGVIKSYQLLAESDSPVRISPNSSLELTYKLDSQRRLVAFDTLVVDSDFGFAPDRMNSTAQERRPVIKTIEPGYVEGSIRVMQCVTCSSSPGNSQADENDNPVSWSLPSRPERNEQDFDDPEYDIEYVKEIQPDLKPRHMRIIEALHSERTITSRELSKKIGRSSRSLNHDLRYLVKNNVVGRVKVGNVYKYYIQSIGEKVLIGEKEDDETVTNT